ncbi:MarR family winged helix-turn-helix transcriptional regulator [Sedimentitalea nanhaiensis]|uniref:DNA-binding transcriptional regulator, MarR family n=1 Tax=Sedimentitalea nanhaiensis TaxID=999627 RepID=A0A1I7CJU4_9RHOB|nr:MarR family winged helix-turn-helix transcriptional regulator [Sedimentitalea nanhaiensis]SFT99669.1 DNA-binding transcriptional regulator, MarR family [Sedimentitalea nanhaiensis]
MKPNDFNLSGFLPYKLAVLASRISKVLSTIYEERFGLSMPEWRVLVHVARCEKVSVRDIHNCVNLEKPRVSRAVAKMVEAGLLAKTASTRDQRLVEIELTEAGQRVLNDIIPEAMSFQARLMGAFSEDEASHFDDLIEQLHDELDKHANAPRRSSMDTNISD